MSETPTKKVPISQFQIKNAKDVPLGPITPVKIAPPPPAPIKRSKSLKTDRTTLKRYISAPNNNTEHDQRNNVLTLPRQSTVPIFKTASIVSQDEEKAAEQKAENKKEQKTEIKTEDETENKTEKIECFNLNEKEGSRNELPEPAAWQAVVNTHRRGSSMTFVSTQNWAHFDTITLEKECEEEKEKFDWNITVETWSEYESSFHGIRPLHGFISGKQAKEFLSKTGISREPLAAIWCLADMDHDGSLSLVEFAVAMHCVSAVEAGVKLPATVPRQLRDALLFHVNNNTTTTLQHVNNNNNTTRYHVNNRNDLLSSLNQGDDLSKSPEKSSLKSVGSTSKGANVTFLEESCACAETLPRSRPRPTRKLLTTTPLHLRAQPCHSSSSYYSSDNSTSDYESDTRIDRRLEMSDSEKEKKKKSGEKKDRKAKKSKSDNKQEAGSPSLATRNGVVPEKIVSREHTYEDVGDFLQKMEVDKNDEDVEALIQSSDEEDKTPVDMEPASPTTAPPSMPPPSRQPSRPDLGPPRRGPSSAPPPGPPPAGPPPAGPPPSSPPPEVEESSSSASEGGGNTSSSYKETSENHDPAGYERLSEDKPDTQQNNVIILLDGGEVFDSDESGEHTTLQKVEDVGKEVKEDPSDVVNELPIQRIERPGRSSRSSSVDTALKSFCVDSTNNFTIPAFSSLSGAVCHLTGHDASHKERIVAQLDELKADKHEKIWDLQDAEVSQPDMERLKETELVELRTMIRDYEIHNNALVNLTRELKIELLKVQEQKCHLRSTLKCMKQV